MRAACLISLSLFLFLIGTAGAVDNGATPVTSPTVLIEGYQVTPSSLMPGDTATLTVTLENTNQNSNIQQTNPSSGGVASVENTAIDVFIENIHLEGNGIIVKTADFNRLGSLGPGQVIPVTFLIQAPDKDGIYFPEVWIDVKDGTSTRYPVPVNVNTHIAVEKKPEIILERDLPDQVVPGGDFPLGLTLSNQGQSRADDISVAIDSSTSSISLNSPANYYLDHLDAGSGMTFNLSFSTDKNSPLGLRDVPVTITFRDPDGTRVTQVEHIGVHMEGRAEVSIKSLTTDPIRIDPGPFTMIVRIENTGTDDAKSVQASIDLPMTGNREAFVGKIEPGNDAPAVFYLIGTSSGEIPYNVTVRYTDDYGNHTITQNLVLSIPPRNFTGVLVPAAVLGIVLCGAAALLWKKKRR